MRRCFLSPLFAPLFFAITIGLALAVIMLGFPEKMSVIHEDGKIIEVITHLCYLALFVPLLWLRSFFKKANLLNVWGVYLFLSMCAFSRELGIQHHLSKTDTTPFKSKFFVNPNNPLHEKIIFGLVLLIILAAVLYLAFKYGKHLVSSFFKLNAVTWSTATLCTVGVISKILDRFPSNYKKANHGVALENGLNDLMHVLEECFEAYLPILAGITVVQYFLINREKNEG